MSEKSTTEQFSSILEDIKKYIRLRVDYARLYLGESLVKFLGFIIMRTFLVWMLFFFLFFCGMALAYWLADVTGNLSYSFLITAGIFLVIGLLLIVFRKPLIYDPLARDYIRMTRIDDDDEPDKS